MRKVGAIDFFGSRRLWFGISLALILAGLVSLAIPGFGLKLGIDFVGGSILEARFVRSDVSTAMIGDVLSPLGFGEPIIQQAADDQQRFLIRTKVFDDAQRTELEDALASGIGEFEVLRFEGIAGVIGAELAQKAFLAVGIAAALMLLYITMRFEFRFGVAAVLALLHDVLITIGAFSLLQREINSSFIAALLTVVGYSINDTIVVFDRIRENLRLRPHGRGDFGPLVNRSINETLSRTINTSLTTLLAIGAVFLFGGSTTRDFALALIIGISTGTYSSIFIASPIWAMWRERDLAAAVGKGAGSTSSAEAEPFEAVEPKQAVRPVAPAGPAVRAQTGPGGRQTQPSSRRKRRRN